MAGEVLLLKTYCNIGEVKLAPQDAKNVIGNKGGHCMLITQCPPLYLFVLSFILPLVPSLLLLLF